MNVVVDIILDRSQPGNTRIFRSAYMLRQVCTSLGLVDTWRLVNPLGRDYTFYSHLHSTYSRIDYFFILFLKTLFPKLYNW